MKTVTLSSDQLFELRYLRDRLERDVQREQTKTDINTLGNLGGGRIADAARDDLKAVEVLNHLLR
jgi:hypothetical protein